MKYSKNLILPLLFIVLVGSPERSDAQSQSEMNEMARQDFVRADKLLNEIYTTALGKTFDEESEELFRKSQRAWVAFRDAESESSSDDMRGGSMAPLIYYATRARMTEDRIIDIARRFDIAVPQWLTDHLEEMEAQRRASENGSSE